MHSKIHFKLYKTALLWLLLLFTSAYIAQSLPPYWETPVVLKAGEKYFVIWPYMLSIAATPDLSILLTDAYY